MINRRRALQIKKMYSKPYNITYNLNGGVLTSTNPSTYTIETSEFVLNSPNREGYEFIGWTMNDDNKYVFNSIFGNGGNREYTAHWNMKITQEDVSSNISDLIIDTFDDSNNDGVADSYIISFIGSANFERLNLPIKNLVKGQEYILSFTEFNNATSGSSDGYYTTMYGCYVNDTKQTTVTGSVKEVAREQGGLIAEWVNGANGGVSVLDGKSLNGSRDVVVKFTATAKTMYWIWDYGLVTDGVLYTYNLTNIILKPIVPKIKFSSMTLKDTDPLATFNIQSYDETNLTFNFKFDGESGVEFLYYPITGLANGITYTITFNHKFTGKFINGDNGTYDYGCGILKDISSASLASKMSGITSNWLSNTWIMNIVTDNTESVTLKFTATSDTVYWIWNMANVSDGTIATVDLSITDFNATDSQGGSINYL